MQELGADICKIAVMPQTTADVITLLDATQEMYHKHADRPLISSSTDTCPGAEAFFAAPNVADEPNVAPDTRLTTPKLPIDMVISGRSAIC
jgi:hypothetical protein